MLSERATKKMEETQETSFSMSLKRWCAIIDTYEKGAFVYHTTMPTDGLRDFHEISVETLKFGMPELKAAQYKLGADARALLDSRGLTSVAASGYEAPGTEELTVTCTFYNMLLVSYSHPFCILHH